MIVELLKDDNQFGLKKGQLFKAERYFDPSKITLLNRVRKSNMKPFKKEVLVNQYSSDVKIIEA